MPSRIVRLLPPDGKGLILLAVLTVAFLTAALVWRNRDLDRADRLQCQAQKLNATVNVTQNENLRKLIDAAGGNPQFQQEADRIKRQMRRQNRELRPNTELDCDNL